MWGEIWLQKEAIAAKRKMDLNYITNEQLKEQFPQQYKESLVLKKSFQAMCNLWGFYFVFFILSWNRRLKQDE